MSLLEKYIRKYPAQWLWLHKRWKSTPKRTVLVLNDGKAGHLNQSLAVARQIQRARATQNYGTEDTDIVVVDVKYKSKFFRALLTFASIFASWRCHGRMGFMKMCLEKDSYEELMKRYAEFIVSCGSGLAPVNIFMSKENNARNVVVMDPAIPFSLKKFNFVIAPKHDKIEKGKNIITTTLAPNLIDIKTLEEAGERLKKRANITKNNVVGLLVGGDNPEFALSDNLLKKVLADLLKVCESNDADLLVTTSRRTNKAQESIVKAALQKNPRCRLLVIANENNPEGTIAGILALSDVVIVSGESISMVSEAVSSGKKTVVFSLDKKKSGIKPKHERALENLARDGYILIARSGELISLSGRALKDSSPVKRVDDTDKIYEAMRALI